MSSAVVIVLASGRGERFTASGGAGSKLEALLGGVPVLQRTLDAVRASGLPWHLEAAPHAGMGDSIAAAVRATSDASGWLVLPGDLPLVQASSLRAVADALVPEGVVLPHFEGQRGHPVAFGAAWREALLALGGPEGAAAIVRRAGSEGRVSHVDIADRGIVTDIDTLQDLHRAERMLAGGGA